MRKMWVKKDNLYYKPFYKQKLKLTVFALFLMGFIFLAYQFFYLSQLTDTNKFLSKFLTIKTISPNLEKIRKIDNSVVVINNKSLIRGVHHSLKRFYMPDTQNNFICIKSRQEIPYHQLNDDFCDCIEDGSDETATNACLKGVFYCNHQKDDPKISQKISTSRLNDGICDCCDGSDEWLKLTTLTGNVINCHNRCK